MEAGVLEKSQRTKMQHLVLYVYAINNCLLSQNFLCELLNFVSEVRGLLNKCYKLQDDRIYLFCFFFLALGKPIYLQLTEYKL